MENLLYEKYLFSAIVDNLPDPIVIIDTNYRVLSINHAFEKFSGKYKHDITGKHLMEVIFSKDLFIKLLSCSKCMSPQNTLSFKINGEESVFNAVVTHVSETDGNTSGFVIILKGLSRDKNLSIYKTDIVATISHEFKTPLTSIIMGSTILLDGGIGNLNNGQKKLARWIKDEGEKMSNVLNRLIEHFINTS